jgi:hypothetical protein
VRHIAMHRWLPYLSLVCIVAIIGFLIPVEEVAAKRVQIRSVTDLIPEFDKGKTYRTAISPDESAGLVNDGAVELAPIGYIEDWAQSSFPLPEAVTDHAAVELNGRIYVLGGNTYDPIANAEGTTNHVWMAQPGTNGSIGDNWSAQSNLPPIPDVDACSPTPSPTVERSSLAAVSVSNGNTGWIYAIGGSIRRVGGSTSFSTAAVAVGQVNANGAITWTSPEALCMPRHLISPAAAVVELNGEHYIYVVGGLSRIPGTSIRSSVYVAKVNTSTGALTKPSDGTPGWQTLANSLPVPAGVDGVFNGTMVATQGEVNGNLYNALIYMGGNNTLTDASALVYRGVINPTTKEVSWQSSLEGNPNFSASLDTARVGLRAVVYDNSSLMVIGGRNGSNPPFNNVLSNVLDDKLELRIPDSIASFYENDKVLPANRGRSDHAAVIVPVGSDHYVYVLGGVGNSNNDNNGFPNNTVFIGKISKDPNEASGYALNGWYYSDTYQIDIANARLLAVRWNTAIDTSSPSIDIRIEYRTNPNPEKLDSAWTPWELARDTSAPTGRNSINGNNSNSLPEGLNFIYFEYRAFLSTAKPLSGAWKTPTLLKLGIEVEVDGFPNLIVKSVSPVKVDNQLRRLDVTIANSNPQNWPNNNPLLPVDDGSNGTFFVDVYVYKPGEAAPRPTVGGSGHACAQMHQRDFPVEGQYTIRNWYKPTSASCSGAADALNISTLFPVDGEYTIYVAVDSGNGPMGLVAEAEVANTQGESDNISEAQKVSVVGCPVGGCEPLEPGPGSPIILLPIVSKGAE